MKRLIAVAAALVTLQACQDATQPVLPAGPELSEVGIDASNNLFARVSLGGTLIAGNRVTSVTYLGTGQYEVTFNRNMTTCAYVATTNSAFSQAIQAFTAGGHLSANGVFIEVKNQGGGLLDGPFNLVATCGGTGIRFAVVGYSNDLVRSTAGTTLSGGFGQYSVTFPTAVNTCAFLAAVADPANGLVFSPSGVYVANGSDNRTVYIETKNPGGGIQAGVPFHLEVVCSNSVASKFAVVRANGTKARGSSGSTSTHPSTGNYNVGMGVNLSACAVVGTRGSVGAGVPFSPATVEVTPGAGPNSTGIQVRDLLFFGGNLADQGIHVAAVC